MVLPPLLFKVCPRTVDATWRGLSNLCPKSVRCARERSGAAANRRAVAAHRRRDRAAARLGAPLRTAVADADRSRVPALLRGRRQPGAPDARAARDGAVGEGSCRRRAGRAGRERAARAPTPSRPSSAGDRAARRRRRRTRPSTRCWPSTRSTPSSRASCCRSCASSATAGRGETSRSRRSTSPRTCSAGACSASRVAGTAARPARGARVPAWRAARPRAHHLRARAARARLADHVPRRGHAVRHARGDGAAGRPGGARAGGDRSSRGWRRLRRRSPRSAATTPVWLGGAGGDRVEGARFLDASPLAAAAEVAAA